MNDKLRHYFEEMVVFKDLKKSNFFSSLSLPSFMRDWLLKKFMTETGEFNQEEMLDFIRVNLPRKEDWTATKSKIVTELERVRFLAKVSVDVDIKTSDVSFSLPDFGLTTKETIIPREVWATSANGTCQHIFDNYRSTFSLVLSRKGGRFCQSGFLWQNTLQP